MELLDSNFVSLVQKKAYFNNNLNDNLMTQVTGPYARQVEDDPVGEATQKALSDWALLVKSTQNCGIDQQITKYLDSYNPIETRIKKNLEISNTEMKRILELAKSIELKASALTLISKELQ
ncbi:hypothetical protein HDV06_000085 [Boothiomyces sp. JEL0866]|nr:hypothetical protein HDV06_000085 [Boothiomyces sp. JEL0866]